MRLAKRKVERSANTMKLDLVPAPPSSRSTKRKNGRYIRADRQLLDFLNNLGSNIESFIDATPLGVPTPEPWHPSTDKKKAMLSNPISILSVVRDAIDTLCPVDFLGKKMGRRPSASWVLAPSKMLMSLREGLAAAVMAEDAVGEHLKMNVEIPVMVNPGDDDTVSSCEVFVDLSADRWGNSSRAANLMRQAAREARLIKQATVSKIFAVIDNLTLRVNGIVVTSDDCSVECSLSNFVPDDDFEACSPREPLPESICCDNQADPKKCPSAATEISMDGLKDTEDEDSEGHTGIDGTAKEENGIEEKTHESETANGDLVIDEGEYVMTEEPGNVEEDFVYVDTAFDITFHS